MKIDSLRWIFPMLGIAVGSAAYGQTGAKGRSIVYDFASKQDAIVPAGKTFSDGVSVDSGLNDYESFTVTVMNLNTMRYSVKVQVAPKSYFSSMPSQFKSLVPAGGGTAAGGEAPDKTTAAQQAEAVIDQIATYAQAQMNLVATMDEAKAAARRVRKRALDLLTTVPSAPAKDADAPIKLFNANLAMLHPGAVVASSLSDAQLTDLLSALGQSAVDLAASAIKNPNPALEATRAALASPDASQQVIKAVATIQLALTGDYLTSVSGTFEAMGDETDVTITVTDNQASPAKALDPVSIAIPTNGGFKTDFSGGVMLTGLVNATYRSIPNPAVTGTYLAQARGGTDARITDVFFAHSYFRPSARLRGIELGVSLGISVDQTPVYAAGLSLLVGRSQRLGITLGESFGSVTRVDGAGPFTSATIPTTTVFMSRPFVALSYNF